MRGNLRQRSKGSWTLTLSGREDGRLRQTYHTVKGTKRDAEKELAKLINDMDTGHSPPDKMTVRAFFERWLRDHVWREGNLSPETAQVYQIIVEKHIVPALGSIRLQKLTPDRIEAYYTSKLADGRRNGKGGLSPRTVRHHHRLLHVALETAVKWQLVTRNVADAVAPPKYRQEEMKTFDQDGLNAFLESIRDSQYHPLFYALLYTGLRRSEALALRWQDVDVDLGYISVHRTLHQLNDKSFVIRQPKSDKSRRTVALPPSLSTVLRRHRESQRTQGLVLGAPVSDADLVFAHPDGSELLPHSITNVWKRLAKQAGFEGIRLHDARHTHASLMMLQGVNPKVVSERLGHASVLITLDTYSHVLPGIQEAAARAFDAGLNGHRESNPEPAGVESLLTGAD